MTHRIGIIGGDGIGPDVIAEGLKVIGAAGVELETVGYDLGGARYGRDGTVLPDETIEEWRSLDALYLGAVGTPEVPPGVIERGLLLKMRFALDLYVNLRPFAHPTDGIDFRVVRENTEGLYHSLLRRSANRLMNGRVSEDPEMDFDGISGEVAWDPRPISRAGSERLVRLGFDYAQRRNGAPKDGISRVTCVDKSNVTRGCQLFRKVFNEISEEFPDIANEAAFIDAFTMWMIRNPEWFDVIVTTNMFGDIATDLGSVLQGGMGMAASGNIGDEHGLFEPVHGSSPKHAGKGIVNPIATLNSVQLMLEWLGMKRDDDDALAASDIIERAITDQLLSGDDLTYDLGGTASTSDVGDSIVGRVRALLAEHYS